MCEPCGVSVFWAAINALWLCTTIGQHFRMSTVLKRKKQGNFEPEAQSSLDDFR
jgi:hypothetical protein